MHSTLIGARARSRRLGLALALAAAAGMAVTACQPAKGTPGGGLPTASASATEESAAPEYTTPGKPTKPEKPTEPGTGAPVTEGDAPDLAQYNVEQSASQVYDFGTAAGRYSDLNKDFRENTVPTKAVINKEWQRYAPFSDSKAYKFTANSLDLTAYVKSGVSDGGIASGRIITQKTYRPKASEAYIFQIRAKVPAGKSVWPAFWLYGDEGNSSSEIDILEFFGNSTAYTGYDHGGNNASASGGKLKGTDEYKPGTDFSKDYHNYTLVWTADGIKKYVDSTLVKESSFQWVKGSDPTVILNLATGGKGQNGNDIVPPPSQDPGQFPASFSIQSLKILKGSNPSVK